MKGQLLPQNLKVRENANLLKEKLVACWSRIISQTNLFDCEIPSIFNKKLNEQIKLTVEADQQAYNTLQAMSVDKQQMHFKVFVGKGNNSMLVRSLFKARFWWLLHDKEEMEKVNFMWTQCRKNQIMQTIKTKLISAKDQESKDNQQSPPKRKRTTSSY